jgi:hypothetical protein
MSAAASVRGLAMRLARADACGVIEAEATADSRITVATFVRVGISPDVFEGSDIEVTSAGGTLCIDDKGTDTLKGIDLELEICNVNESILELLTGAAVLTDYAAPVEQVGFVAAPTDVALGLNYASLEVWTRNANNDACAVGANPARPYLHWLFPRTSRWQISDIGDFGDGAQTITLTGYGESSTAFTAVRAADEWTAADLLAINAGGPVAMREVTALPAQIAGSGYDT